MHAHVSGYYSYLRKFLFLEIILNLELLCEYNFFLRIRKFSNSNKNSYSKNKTVSEYGPSK